MKGLGDGSGRQRSGLGRNLNLRDRWHRGTGGGHETLQFTWGGGGFKWEPPTDPPARLWLAGEYEGGTCDALRSHSSHFSHPTGRRGPARLWQRIRTQHEGWLQRVTQCQAGLSANLGSSPPPGYPSLLSPTCLPAHLCPPRSIYPNCSLHLDRLLQALLVLLQCCYS